MQVDAKCVDAASGAGEGRGCAALWEFHFGNSSVELSGMESAVRRPPTFVNLKLRALSA